MSPSVDNREMSITVTLSGKTSVLETFFHPPLSLDEKYECGLLYFSVFNSVPNINNTNNIFSYGNKGQQIKIPCGSYDLDEISEYLKNNITDCHIKIYPNCSTLKCAVYCDKTLNFDIENSLGNILGFDKTKLEANKWHESNGPVNILPLSAIRIDCDLIQNSYANGTPTHILHEFIPNTPRGFRFIEVPRNVIYFPVNRKSISSLRVKIVDDHYNCIDFRGEDIQLRLHLRKIK